VQVSRLGHRGCGNGPQQCRGCDELLARVRWCVRVVDVEVGVDALSGLLARLTHAFAACGDFSSNGGAQQPHHVVLLRELSFELSRLSQLRVDVRGPRRHGGRCAWPKVPRYFGPRILGDFSVASLRHVRVISLVVDNHHEALMCQVVASGAGVVGAAEPVVRGIEESLEHHWVRHAGEVPLRVPV
jgi:hypothetical protein